jgi:hypothetical protein
MLRPTVSRPVYLGAKHPSVTQDQTSLLSDNCGFVHVGRPLWREDGSVFYNFCWSSLAQSFSVPVPRDTWPYFTVSGSRLPQPGGPEPRIYIPQEQGDPVIPPPPGTGFLFRGLLRLAGLRWRYSNPPPREKMEAKLELLDDCWFVANQSVLAPSPLGITTKDFQTEPLRS